MSNFFIAFCAAIIFLGAFAFQTNAQAMTFKDLIEVLISIGTISPDKADAARSRVASFNEPTKQTVIYQNIYKVTPDFSFTVVDTENSLRFTKVYEGSSCIRDSYSRNSNLHDKGVGIVGYTGQAKGVVIRYAVESDAEGSTLNLTDFAFVDIEKGHKEYQTLSRNLDTRGRTFEISILARKIVSNKKLKITLLSATSTDGTVIKGLPIVFDKINLEKCKN